MILVWKMKSFVIQTNEIITLFFQANNKEEVTLAVRIGADFVKNFFIY